MARKKQYIEEEVVQKAMRLFWSKGYENTSMQMLEKAMGINKFSIYASFGSKHGLFIKSLKHYKAQNNTLFEELRKSASGMEAIKKFFYDSVATCQLPGNEKGCLLTNTYNEFASSEDKIVQEEVGKFMADLKQLFIEKLKLDGAKDMATIEKEANYLVIAKHGLAAATRTNSAQEINDYIEMIFSRL